jgi:hypothetical protein
MFKKNLNAQIGFYPIRFVLPTNAITLKTGTTSSSLKAQGQKGGPSTVSAFIIEVLFLSSPNKKQFS